MRLHVPVALRWADLDAYGHVNNVAIVRLLEEARIAAFWRPPVAAGPPHAGPPHAGPPQAGAAPTEPDPVPEGWPTAVLQAGPTAPTHTLVARTEIEYLRPLGYHREPVVVQMWLGHLGGASIDVCYEVTTPAPEGAVVARATTALVLVDAATGRPRRLTVQERAAWEPYAGDPVPMRRRA